jgi:predicted membrane protein
VDRGRLLLGLVLLGVGGVLLAGHADLVDPGEIIATWWPLAVVAAGLLRFVGHPRDLGGAIAVTGAGLVLLAWRLDLVGAVLLPLVFIGAGLVVLFRTPHAESMLTRDADLELVAVFGSRDTRVTSPRFEGGRAIAVFGGVDLDLRSTTLPREGATLEVVAVFGDVDVMVPMGWAVEVSGPAVFGDLDDRTLGAPAGAPVLRIRATVVLGDVELRTDASTHARASA